MGGGGEGDGGGGYGDGGGEGGGGGGEWMTVPGFAGGSPVVGGGGGRGGGTYRSSMEPCGAQESVASEPVAPLALAYV